MRVLRGVVLGWAIGAVAWAVIAFAGPVGTSGGGTPISTASDLSVHTVTTSSTATAPLFSVSGTPSALTESLVLPPKGAIVMDGLATESNYIYYSGPAGGPGALQFNALGTNDIVQITGTKGIVMIGTGATGITLNGGSSIGVSFSSKLNTNGNDILQSSGASITNTASTQLKGGVSDGSTAIANKSGNANALTTAGAKVHSFYSDALSTEVAFVDKNGGFAIRTSPTLPTCAAALEGLILRQAGGTSGTRTKICVCGSDGGGTPAYAWENITGLTGAVVGTSTSC